MNKIVPKDIADEEWERLTPHKSYAILCGQDDSVFVKIGVGKSFYLGIWGMRGGGRLVNSLEYESGTESLLFKLSENVHAVVGRSLDCTIKIMNSIISRKHMEFRLYGNVLMVRDYGSTNGTYLLNSNIYFSIDDYLEHHPIDDSASQTLDEVHQTFGPNLNDFFKNYLANKALDDKEREIRLKMEKEDEKNDLDNN